MTDASDGKRDFFVSFNAADRTQATWVAWVLEEAGYSVFFQDWDFRGSFPEHMDRAHREAHRTLAILSDNYLGSEFARSEAWARYAQDAVGREDRLVPVKVGGVSHEGVLRQFVYADLTGCDEQEAQRRLLQRVRMAVDAGYRAKPSSRPSFPGVPRREVPSRPAFPSQQAMPTLGQSDLKSLAYGLSRFLRNVNTKPPLTLAITGRWGSGKSSLMRLLMADLQRHGGRAVWFNAWHHREEEHLLAALFETIRREAPPGWWSWPGLAFRARLFWARTKGPLLNLLYLALFAGIALITVRLALPEFRAEHVANVAQGAAGLLGEEIAESWKATLAALLAGSGGVALLALWLRGKLVALPANPAKLVAALARRASLADFGDKLAFRHRFGEQFEDVCNALLTRTFPGLVILIDDLDRCQPEDVLKVLEAVNYLVSAGPCTVVLGMDRRQVEYCVGLGFEKLVEGLPEEELVYAGEESRDKSGKQRAFARHYLEKLVNIEVPVPALDEAATEAMLLRGTGERPPDAAEEPPWLATTKRWTRGAFQVARVGLLAFIAGMALTWGAERLRLPAPTPPADKPAASTVTAQTNPTPTPQATPAAPQQEQQPAASFEPARVEVEQPPATREVPGARRWLWWGPTLLALALAALFGTAAVVHRERQVVKDSPDFAKALRCVKPLLAAVNATPRAIKRYQNRMRYLAARLRPSTHEPDKIDSLLHWLGKKQRRLAARLRRKSGNSTRVARPLRRLNAKLARPLVPLAWFVNRPRQAIPEPALILMGAIELFAPRAFAEPPDKLIESLDAATSPERAKAWAKVREAFANAELGMPDPEHVKRYAAFVQVTSRPAAAPTPAAAEVIQFPTGPTPGPRSA